MASVTLGICTSHSPMLSTDVEDFSRHEERDQKNPNIPDFEALLEKNGDALAGELTREVAIAKHERNQKGISRLQQIFAESDVDAAVIVGDDQAEWFDKEAMPALAVYWNDWVESRPPPVERMHPTLQSGYWGHYGDGTNRRYPVAADLGENLVKNLSRQGFDIFSVRRQPDQEHLGHAWGFVYQRIMVDTIVPMVPIMLNTYFPPNQPTASRCWQLGQVIRETIEAMPDDRKVAVMGSGGLSHFVVDADLDRRVLEALRANDAAAIADIPEEALQSGTSEIKNWIVAASAASHLDMELIDYVPYYRTLAGSGIGMAFAAWR